MNEIFEARSRELDPSSEQVIAQAVFTGSSPAFLGPDYTGPFDIGKVTVLQADDRSLPLNVCVCMHRFSFLPGIPLLVYHDRVSDPVYLSVPFLTGGNKMYFSAQFEDERLISVGESAEPFVTVENTAVWIGFPQRGTAATAYGSSYGRNSVFVLTPGISQIFSRNAWRDSDQQAVSVAILDQNPLY